MEVLMLDAAQLMGYRDELNQHLQLAFNSKIEVDINEELLCGVLATVEGLIVACGFAYHRQMSQGCRLFKAGIVGGIAVHPNYRKQGLCKEILLNIDQAIEQADVEQSFLFAYEPKVYGGSGYTILDTPIHYFDPIQAQWNTYVYRGGMVKSHNQATVLSSSGVIEFKGPIY